MTSKSAHKFAPFFEAVTRGRCAMRTACLKVVLALALLMTLGLMVVEHQGLSWDEPAGISTVKWNYDYVKHQSPMPYEVLKYNGTLFNFGAEAVYQVSQLIHRPVAAKAGLADHLQFSGATPTESAASYDRRKDVETRDRITIKHPLTFLTSLLAYGAVAAIVRIWWGGQSAWLGVVVLALFPRFWGHSFFNHKDIPFAAVFALSILAGVYLVNEYLQEPEKALEPPGPAPYKIGPLTCDRRLVYAALYGVLAGILTGIRFGGFMILLITYLGAIIVRLGLPRAGLGQSLLRVTGYHSVTALVCLGVTLLSYPASWSAPVQWLWNAKSTMANYPWQGVVLFHGSLYPNGAVPWYYIPGWFLISVPVILQVLFGLGLVVLARRYANFSRVQRIGTVLVLLQVFLLPLGAIAQGSAIYNEIRHFSFITPGIAAIATGALLWIYQVLRHRWWQRAVIACSLIISSQIVWDMAQLHPYEYLYFNRLSRAVAQAPTAYETDYWGLSARAAMEWINDNGQPDLPVLIGVNIRSASIYAARDRTYLPFAPDSLKQLKQQPFYYLASPVLSYRYQDFFRSCPLVHQVQRQDLKLTLVRQCPAKAIAE
jgi:hypothetical protein